MLGERPEMFHQKVLTVHSIGNSCGGAEQVGE